MTFVECIGVSQEDTMEGYLRREALDRSQGSHDSTELVGGMCHGNVWRARNQLPPRYILHKDGMELHRQ